MKTKLAILAVLVVSIFLIGCSSSQPYQNYNQPQQQGQPQQQVVGGGCGVAPQNAYSEPAAVSARQGL